MKHLILTTLTVLSVSVFAQGRSRTNLDDSPPRFMPAVGLSVFNLTGSDVSDDWDPQSGVSAAALYDLGNGPFFFETGLQYIQTGAQANYTSSFGDFKARVILEYVGVPILGKYFLLGNTDGLYVKAGVISMYNTRREMKFSGFGQSDRSRISGVKDWDFLGQAGLGYKVPTTSTGYDFGGELTYNRSVTTIAKDAKVYNEGLLLIIYMAL